MREALSHVTPGARDVEERFFTALGPAGMKKFASDLESLTLSRQTEEVAEFSGMVFVNNKSIQVRAVFVPDGKGGFRLLEVQ